MFPAFNNTLLQFWATIHSKVSNLVLDLTIKILNRKTSFYFLFTLSVVDQTWSKKKNSATTANMMSDMISLMLILDYDPFLNFLKLIFY